jgi:predicted DNA binding protein
MSFIVEYVISSPVLQTALQTVPDMVIQTEELRITPEGSAKHVFWANGGNFQQFETGLESDPTIAEYAILTEVADRRLYRGTISEEGWKTMTYPVTTELDIVFLDITITYERSTIRARVPTREALNAYRNFCRDRDIPFRLNRIYREERTVDGGSGARYGVTEAQREALVSALKCGYFAIPRESTLEEIAGKLDISTQALSTRLRRGQTNLVSNLLAPSVT